MYNSWNKTNQGFTLIELIMVTIILGILAAVAIPRFLSVTSRAEKAVEVAVITQLKSAIDQYAYDMYVQHGRYEFPDNPFDLVDVDNYFGDFRDSDVPDWPEDKNDWDGAWWVEPAWEGTSERDIMIGYEHRNNEYFYWTYSSADMTDEHQDDRGANIGEALSNGFHWNGECFNCDDQSSDYLSNNP